VPTKEQKKVAKQNGDDINTKSLFGQLIGKFSPTGGGLFTGAIRAAKEREKKIKRAGKK